MMLTFALVMFLSQSPEDAMRQMQLSHIEANVPAEADFGRFLQRDLDKYFKTKRPNPFKLTYEFLRIGATQTGIAYPKFYLWVQLSEKAQSRRPRRGSCRRNREEGVSDNGLRPGGGDPC